MTKETASKQIVAELKSIKQHLEITGRAVDAELEKIVEKALDVSRFAGDEKDHRIGLVMVNRQILVTGVMAELETIFIQVSPLVVHLSQFCFALENAAKVAGEIADVAMRHPEEAEPLMRAHELLQDADILLTQVKEWK